MPAGRPKFEIDFETVEKLASLMCTQEEIASFLGCDVRTLQRSYEFCRVYKKGQDGDKMSLRRKQFKIAEKNASMAIFLGKNYLGQKDYVEVADNQELNNQIQNIANLINNPTRVRTEEDLDE